MWDYIIFVDVVIYYNEKKSTRENHIPILSPHFFSLMMVIKSIMIAPNLKNKLRKDWYVNGSTKWNCTFYNLT